jgi:hypothetical protein|tara:strand:- start:402 stop:815 length:414 start_codon:yes stop_codon:yes gene_type:complete
MPNPEHGCDSGDNSLNDVFVSNGGVYAAHSEPWKMTAAISGAHTLGSASIANSGYDGWWASAEQAGIFNNDYYHGILMKGWGVEKAVDGNSAKNQWIRIDGMYGDAHKEMMLDTDMCLAVMGLEDDYETQAELLAST